MKTWIQLSPFGQFYHSLGKQYLSQETLKNCVKKTRTWRFRLGFKKIPIYIGHPDDSYFQQFPEHMNTTAEGSSNGLFGIVVGALIALGGTIANILFSTLIFSSLFTFHSPKSTPAAPRISSLLLQLQDRRVQPLNWLGGA